MDWLSIAGSLASLIGLSQQMFDSYLSNKKDPNIAILKGLTQTASAWKTIHNEYQSLQQDCNRLCEFINDGSGKAKRVNAISFDALIGVFNGSQISAVSRTFARKLDASIETISTNNRLNKSEIDKEYEKIRKGLGNQYLTCIKEIVAAESIVVELHDEFLKFFNKIAPILRKSEISKEDAAFILDSYHLWSLDYNQLMGAADKAILSLLTLLELFINRIENK